MSVKTSGKLKLKIDSSDNKKTMVSLGNCELVKEYKEPRQQKILEVIAEALKKKKVNPEQISEIKINLGPGSYTGLRVGCAVVNALSWGLGIKVNGKKQIEPIYE